MGCIYLIRNLRNNKCYIGQTIHDAVKTRIRDHLAGKGNRIVKQAIEKYGKDAFTYEILHDGIIPEFLDTLEKEAIEKFNTLSPHGYNLDTGGSNGTHSEETRRKISEANTGKRHSEETRRKMSEARKDKKGKPHSEETRRKMSEAHKGRKFSKEHRENIANTLRGKPLSRERRKKISIAKKGNTPWMKGKSHSEESRKKISIAKKGKPCYALRGRPSHNKGKPAHNRSSFFITAYNLFLSLPPDMNISEKRKILRENFPDVTSRRIYRWVHRWHSEG